jgi:hypothetical protein
VNGSDVTTGTVVVVGAAVDVGPDVDGGFVVVATSVLPVGAGDGVVTAPSPPSPPRPSLHAASAAVIVPARNPRRVSRRAFSSTLDLRILAADPIAVAAIAGANRRVEPGAAQTAVSR